MVGYSYTYKTVEEVFSATSISGSPLFIITSVVLYIAIVLALLYVFFPIMIIGIQKMEHNKKEKQKKKYLRQVILQKEIETEIEQEIHE